MIVRDSVKAMLLLVDCKEKIISDPSLSSRINKSRPIGSQDFDLPLDYGEVGESVIVGEDSSCIWGCMEQSQL